MNKSKKYKKSKKSKKSNTSKASNTYKISKASKTSNTYKISKASKRLTILKGGKYVDEGAFGCVITPALPCSNKDKKLEKSVSKIIRDTRDDITNEMKISAILTKLDPDKKYYLTYKKYCYLNNIPKNRDDIVSVHYTDDDLTTFDIDDGQENKDEKACHLELSLNPINIIMEYGGYSLSSIMKTSRKITGTRATMHNMFIDNLRVYFKHLILGIVKMHNNRIVNRDIKQKNIMMMWNKETNNVAIRYIDFGLSNFLTTDFCHHISNINRDGTNIYISPDIHISAIIRKYRDHSEHYIFKKISHDINSYVKKALLKLNEKDIINNIDKNIAILIERIKYLYDNNKILPIYFGSSKNKFNGYIQKGDVYALGYSIFETLYYYSEIDVQKNKSLYNLLLHMIEFDPEKRYNAVQCLAHPYFQDV
jgi:serine/threonine protein kinase